MAAVGFIGTVETLSGLIIGLILAGSSIAFFASMQSTLVYRAAPHEMRGRYLGLISLCIGTGLIGFANIGITAEYFGAANAMWIIAAEGALPFLIVVLCWRGLHADLGFRVRTA
jgi:predicted MFS family arabinose efflux permease